jgi:hypothetical protein
VQAVRHWWPYLWGRSFRVRMDHYSLKSLLDQRLSTVPQHQWINKFFGFDFTMEYRPGRLNTVADALSRRDADPADAEGDAEGAKLCIRSATAARGGRVGRALAPDRWLAPLWAPYLRPRPR